MAEANVFSKWKKQFELARSKRSELHDNEQCCYQKWKNWYIQPENYRNFILIRECHCGKYRNTFQFYAGRKFIPIADFNQDGLEIHVDPEERCEYEKPDENGTCELKKECKCTRSPPGECHCGKYKNTVQFHAGRKSIPIADFDQDGLDIHIDPKERCEYKKPNGNGTFELKKVCKCPSSPPGQSRSDGV